MNRKKAMLIISAIEVCLLTTSVVLFLSDIIRPVTFAVLLGVIGLVSSTIIVVALRKLPPM